MSSRHCLRGFATAIASATVAISLSHRADAGVVGHKAMLTWTAGSAVVDQSTFVVDEAQPEYAWSIDVSGTWAAITVDMNEKGLKLRYDSGDPFGSVVAFNFGSNARFRIEMTPEVMLDAAVLSGMTSVAGFAPGSISIERNILVIDLSNVDLLRAGAGLDIEYQTSMVPAPGAMALLGIAALTGFRRRR
jgi:MYXO-CTERM domain-containing protein